jgi:hypothetical protein
MLGWRLRYDLHGALEALRCVRLKFHVRFRFSLHHEGLLVMPSRNFLTEDDEEATEFYAQLGRCIAVWATVESYILFLLQACLVKADIEAVAASFYAVENFRSKLGMVDSALTISLKGAPLLQEWSGKGGLYH